MIIGEYPITRRSSQAPPPDRKGGNGRLAVLIFGVIMTFVIIIVQMFRVQVLNQAANVNKNLQLSLRTYRPAATRGLIYDRNGVPLVLNSPAYRVLIIPVKQITFDSLIQQKIERQKIYTRLAEMIGQPGVTAGSIFTKVVAATNQFDIFEPVVVAENVPRERALAIKEQALLMPGVEVDTVGARVYPYKNLLGNLLGWTGRISPQSAEDLAKGLPDPYPPTIYDIANDRIGITGIERVAEAEMRGIKGSTSVIRDASGEIKDTVGVPVSPTAGNNIRLTLDLKMQTILSDSVGVALDKRDAKRAAAVALDPRTGEILGLYSYPGIDDNLFAQGISVSAYREISDNVHIPLLNHAIQDLIEPGSTFKIVTAMSLLEEGYVTPDTVINDPGVFELPQEPGRQFFCWIGLNGGRHGPETVSDALRDSCNTFFRKAVGGYGPENIPTMGPRPLAKWAARFGIGEPNNFELDSEVGIVPTETYKLRVLGQPWTTGDSYNVAIGQGDTRVTVLEMANVIATIANGGTLYQPQIIKEVRDDKGNLVKGFTPKVIRQLGASADNMALIQRSLRSVVSPSGPRAGTAAQASLDSFGFFFSGKTGTAEFCYLLEYRAKLCPPDSKYFPTHAWFVAYAPSENPTLALAIYIYNGGQGSQVAAPVAQRVFNKWFDLGIPEDKLMPILTGRGTSE